MLDGVAGGLGADDGAGAALGLGRVLGPGAHLVEDVEVLADRDLGAHLGVDRVDGCVDVVGQVREGVDELVVARDEREVAEQDGGGEPELVRVAGPALRAVDPREVDVCRRVAAAGVGLVHDVVVEERGGLEELEARADAQDSLALGGVERAAVSAPRPVGEGGAQALAAGEHARHRVVEGERLGSVRGLVVEPCGGQVVGDDLVDAGAYVFAVHEGEGAHASTLAARPAGTGPDVVTHLPTGVQAGERRPRSRHVPREARARRGHLGS